MKNLLSRRSTRLFPALLGLGLLTALPALAQPGMDDGGMGGPGGGGPGMNGGGNGMNGGGQGRGGNRGDRTAMREQMLKRQLQSAGFTDETLLTTVTTYVKDNQTARKPLTDAANALSQALTDDTTTDAQIATLWADFNTALAAEKARVATAEAALDQKIGYSKNPKLAAALTLAGVIGDATSYLGAQQGGRGGPGGGGGQGGMGGPGGGGQGGGPGGQGGFGGGMGGPGGGPGGGGPPDMNN